MTKYLSSNLLCSCKLHYSCVAKFEKANCSPCWHGKQFVTQCSVEMEKSAGAVWATGQWRCWPNTWLHGTWVPLCWSGHTKNTECISESSLPFCHSGDRPMWGKRLIEGLACIRMWLLIEVWEGCQSFWLCPPLPSVFTTSFSTKHLSPACSTFTLFLLSGSARRLSSLHAAFVSECFPSLSSPLIPLADARSSSCPTSFFFSSPEGQSCCWWSLEGDSRTGGTERLER